MAEDDAAPASLLTFPCVFPIKVMGRREDGFAQSVSDIVQRHAPDFHPHTMEMRPSKNGRFISLTCTINAQSREQLDALYMELTKHPLVMMVL
jgi:putative lipoic acid-binding regulatory protein